MHRPGPSRYSRWILPALALVFVGIAVLIPLPAGLDGAGSTAWPRLANVFLVLLVFAIVAAMQRSSISASPRIGWAVALLAFLLGVTSLVAHRWVASTSTCRYYDQVLIVGDVLRPLAADYLTRYPDSGCEDLLKAFTGHAEEAWTEESLRRAELLLGGTFVWIVPMAALGVMTIVRILQRTPVVGRDVLRGAGVFISYASEDRRFAEDIQLALTGLGYRVFFDKESLPAGGDFHSRIRSEIAESDLLIFLISPDSVTGGSYALTELKFAREKWAHPKGRVLPVMVRQTEFALIPKYLSAVTVLEPEGNIAAETARAVEALR